MERIFQRIGGKICGIVLGAAGTLVPALGFAGTVQVEADAGFGMSNNINRTLVDGEWGTMQSAGLRFAVEQQWKRVNTDLVGDLAWVRFSGSNYSAQFSGTATARVVVEVMEDRLHWTVEDNFGQTRRDLFAVPTPDNSENVNFLSTGPELRLAPGAFLDVVLGGRFTRVDYQHSPADTQRYSAWAGVEHALPNSARLGVHATHERIEPEQDAAFPSYDRSTAFASYSARGARTSLSLDAGLNRIVVDQDTSSGYLVRAQIDREFGEIGHLTLRVGRELTDSGESLSLGPGILLVQSQQAGSLVQEAQPFTNSYAGVAWYMAGTHTEVQLYGGWYDENYLYANLLDRHRTQLGLDLSRRVAERIQVSAGADYSRDLYKSSLLTDNNNMTARLGGSWSAVRRTSVAVAAVRSLYKSNADSGVNETQFWLRISYGVEPDRAPRLR